jgi:RND family efflux transporter MFP subunit
MLIDPRQQQATVGQMKATERQKKALYDFNTVELGRQQKLFDAGVTSHDAFDTEQQAFQNAKADYESAVELRKAQEEQLAYYSIRAPFDGVVGDIPVHVGDFASPMSSPATVLTTVDEGKDLEAYIYIPTERSSEVRMGQEVDLTDNSGNVLEKTAVSFISPEVDPTLQGILVKAPVHSGAEILRTAQLVKARVVWSTKPMAVVPVLAVTRQGGLPFVYVMQQQNGHFAAVQKAVTLGDTVGNQYSISSGLSAGDKVIVSGTQFLVNGMPVIPIGG